MVVAQPKTEFCFSHERSFQGGEMLIEEGRGHIKEGKKGKERR